MVPDYENEATAEGIPSGATITGMETTFQAENYFSPIGNENNNMQTPFETTKEDEFLNSIFVDGNLAINEET
ncbi:hypothetical protein VNO78_25002 [Psophocarpus tetragonolobus]|uniref:Uncharacterized protein n=1 Tax=Psophocarpus tetragonolobus TaxID=3891 RepID=A0AAN9S8Q9_PSOTE